MYSSTDPDSLPALDKPAPDRLAPRSSPLIAVPARAAAGNDATYADPAIEVNAAPPPVERARAATGLDNVAGAASFAWPPLSRVYQAARAARARILGELVAAAFQAAVAVARRAHARRRQRRQAKAVSDALRELDDRTLHDLGFDRSEITSVAAEVAGAAERTRVRTQMAWCGPSASADLAR